MNQISNHVRRLLASEDGPTTCEYAILLALIIVAAIAGLRLLGPNLRVLYTAVTAAFA